MIIDFHTHTFPDALAEKTIPILSEKANIINYTDGTNTNLLASMKEASITYSVILPIATKPTQTEKLNILAAQTNETSNKTGLISFGSIHPDNEDYKERIKQAASLGIKGMKLHPCYQDTPADDIRILNIVDYMQQQGLITIFHAGYDAGYPGNTHATPQRFLNLIETTNPQKLVLAHMGSWGCWEEVEELLVGQNVYFDTAYCLVDMVPRIQGSITEEESKMLSSEQFERIVKKHGADKVLFASDSPWGSQKETLERLEATDLTDEEKRLIKGKNAAKLLGL